MSNILIVTGSARKGRVADSVVELIKQNIEGRGDVAATVADLKDINLPFFDSEVIPADENFTPTGVAADWQKMVQEADGVVFAMPEYNHSMSAIQKNAIDWLFADWAQKPVAIVGYGWSGGSLAIENAKVVLDNVKAKLLPEAAKLHFMQQLNPDGSVADEQSTVQQITATIDELVEATK